MTDRELMQQALDAATEELPKVDERETVFCSIQGHHLRALCEFVRAALTQPEPEPVAWMYDWYDETEDIDGVPIGGIVHDWISKDYDEAHSPTMGCHNIRPLYTAPPQRKPLPPQSPCEMTQAEGKMFKLGWLECEAAHGITGESK